MLYWGGVGPGFGSVWLPCSTYAVLAMGSRYVLAVVLSAVSCDVCGSCVGVSPAFILV